MFFVKNFAYLASILSSRILSRCKRSEVYLMKSCCHAIMFHHFHSANHPKSQGSINAKTLEHMIEWLTSNYNLLSADIFLKKAKKNDLDKQDICLTFDDGLLCQYDIAIPVLDKLKLKAFFFIYSAHFDGKKNYLELFRYFRSTHFNSINDFYAFFFKECKTDFNKKYLDGKKSYLNFEGLKEYPFYTENDRWFRYLRDIILNENEYNQIMFNLMDKNNFNFNVRKDTNLWMDAKQVELVSLAGHLVGLHSHEHPISMHKLSYKNQKVEYASNLTHLKSIIGDKAIESMSHPFGRYNTSTLKVLDELGIQLGFRSNMKKIGTNSLLEIPREDHTNIMNKMIY